MSNEVTISFQDKQAILDAANKRFFVEENKDDPGHYSIQLYGDYRDTNEFLLQTAYDNRNNAEAIIPDEIWAAWEETVSDTAYDILFEAGFDPGDDAFASQCKWFYEAFSIDPPVKVYLGQDVKVNIMLSTPLDRKEDDSTPFMLKEALMHFTGAGKLKYDLEANIGSQAEADEIIHQDSMIKRLVEQQGYTMDDLRTVAKDFFHDFYEEDDKSEFFESAHENGEKLPYDKRFDMFTETHSKFLSTVCQELDNMGYTFGVVTVLAKMSMNDYAKMLQQGSEVTMPKGSMIGVFAPWNGSGSVLGIELDKDLTFKREDIYDTQIEGAKPDNGYTVNQTYGLVSGAWQKPKSIEVQAPERKPALDQQIQSANVKAAQSTGEKTPTVQPER
ncbi:MAG: hypothetical protein DBX40_06820 [Clostridiales bacterium]|nr:MAG: hypothetical protein DBX40_06820 [Clostridiales bacterium]